jgi:hypothetical protein
VKLLLIVLAIAAASIGCGQRDDASSSRTPVLEKRAAAVWAAVNTTEPGYCRHAIGGHQGGGILRRETAFEPTARGDGTWLVGCTSEISCSGEGDYLEPIACGAFDESGTLIVHTCLVVDLESSSVEYDRPRSTQTQGRNVIVGHPCD